MIAFLPPPEGVPIDPIAAPYAIEKSRIVDSFEDSPGLIPAFFMSERATGSIIAATVCSPIKEERNAEKNINPSTILQVLFPVIFKTNKANLLSNP